MNNICRIIISSIVLNLFIYLRLVVDMRFTVWYEDRRKELTIINIFLCFHNLLKFEMEKLLSNKLVAFASQCLIYKRNLLYLSNFI